LIGERSKIMQIRNIFERLKKGEIIPSDDSRAYKMREASFATKALLLKMNNSANPEEIRTLLSEITANEIYESVAFFTPFYINYGKHTRIGKNVFINFNCVFLDLDGITIDDHVLIAPRVNLLTEGHPINPSTRQSLIPKSIHIKKNAWISANATICKVLRLERIRLLQLVL